MKHKSSLIKTNNNSSKKYIITKIKMDRLLRPLDHRMDHRMIPVRCRLHLQWIREKLHNSIKKEWKIEVPIPIVMERLQIIQHEDMTKCHIIGQLIKYLILGLVTVNFFNTYSRFCLSVFWYGYLLEWSILERIATKICFYPEVVKTIKTLTI
jgi:hypothetical protein